MKGTHFLDMEVRISPDTDREQASQVCLLPREDGGRGLSRHEKKLNNQRALTSWRGNRFESGLVKTEKNREDELHPLPIEGKGQDSSGHLNNTSQRRVLTT